MQFWDDDLEPAPLSRLPPSAEPIVVKVPFHMGYGQRQRPEDVDASLYVDRWDLILRRVFSKRSWVRVVQHFPEGSSYTLQQGYAVYHREKRTLDLAPNRSLRNHFKEEYRIDGNVLVVQLSSSGCMVDFQERNAELAKHITVSSIVDNGAMSIARVRDWGSLWTPLPKRMVERPLDPRRFWCFSTNEDIRSVWLDMLDFASLVKLGSWSTAHRQEMAGEISHRIRKEMRLDVATWLFSCFLDRLDGCRVLLVGGLARNIITGVRNNLPFVDLLCAMPYIPELESALTTIGYTRTEREVEVLQHQEVNICDATVFEGMGVPILVLRLQTMSPHEVLLHSANTAQFNAISGTKVMCLYRSMTLASTALKCHDDPGFASRHPEIEMNDDNSRWLSPCETVCPARWCKTDDRDDGWTVQWRRSGDGLNEEQNVGEEESRTEGWGLTGGDMMAWYGSGPGRMTESFWHKSWEDDDCIIWRLNSDCLNSACDGYAG
ncbi:hypothetical protein BKA70DRAFT_1445690 [Coprinopsis sp. MPI-PUGE-AT-0042]|nr:hypothetical protein BKA70DRAFT_1445690 [Coprinopsis sp. MPI-PUGE-AT-0042]